jgi:hypothetical protein
MLLYRLFLLLLLLLLLLSLVTDLFFLVLILNLRWPLRFRLQVSRCSTFRIMCDVPCIAVFCSESIECFPGIAFRFYYYYYYYYYYFFIKQNKLTRHHYSAYTITTEKHIYYVLPYLLNALIWIRLYSTQPCVSFFIPFILIWLLITCNKLAVFSRLRLPLIYCWCLLAFMLDL